MTPEELADILEQIRTTLLPNLNAQIDQWRDNHNGKDDPEDHFSELKNALTDFRAEFEENEKSFEKAIKTLAVGGSQTVSQGESK